MNNILTEAFKAFDLLDEEMFPINKDGEEALKKFMEGDAATDFEMVIDPEADEVEDLKKSYVGDVILNCPVCQSKFYKEPDKVVIDEEKDLANVEEECPYCQTSGGFEIVGEVAPYHKHEEEKPEEEVETEVKVDEEEVVEKSMKKPLKEAPDLGRDLEKYQDWVDYDMKRYGRISRKTKEELDKAGLEVVKDDHGDYEVTAKDKKDLGEAKEDHLPVKKYVQAHKDELTGTSPKAMRADLIKILKKGAEEAEDKDKGQFKSAIEKAKGTTDRGVFSMVSTYLTGIKANPVTESFEEVEVKTDKEKIKIETEGEKTKVEVEPRDDPEEEMKDKEMIAPVSDELKAELTAEEETEGEEGFEDVEIEDFDEESFDELEEKYLRKIYENVQSYKTTQGRVRGNKLVLEGVITFTSGNKKKTQFVFEAHTKTKKGKLKFLGENINLSTSKKAFIITGNVKDKKLVTESFTYNYTAKDAKTGRSQKLYGTVRK